MKQVTIDEIVTRWQSSDRPLFKGSLISDDGCCCAQGDVLRCVGYSDDELRAMTQDKADDEVAKILGISRAHSILLRKVNDSQDGCPQEVLTHPEKVIGSEAKRVLAFWRHLDRMTAGDWRRFEEAWYAAGSAAGSAAAVSAAVSAAWYAAGSAAGSAAAVSAAVSAAGSAAGSAAAGYAAWYAAWYAAAGYAAGSATNEIQGYSKLKAPLFFLPMLGIERIEQLDEEVAA